MKMGEETLENSIIMEKYLGDIIHEKGCKESITVTIKERMRKLTSKYEEIIQIAKRTFKYYVSMFSILAPHPPCISAVSTH